MCAVYVVMAAHINKECGGVGAGWGWGWGEAVYLNDHFMPLRRPTDWSASCEKAEGEKSRSQVAQPSQRAVIATVTFLPLSS